MAETRDDQHRVLAGGVPPQRLRNLGRWQSFPGSHQQGREGAAWDNAPTHGGGFEPFPPEAEQLAGQWWGATLWTGPDTDFADVVNATAAVEFLKQEHDRPFLLVLGLWRTHTPFTAPKRFYDLYDESKVPVPPRSWKENDLAAVFGERWRRTGKGNPGLWRKILRGYLACTNFADWSIGRVIGALDASPYATNTIVIVTSNNGYHCGEKDHSDKSTLWEAAARVPLAIRLPGQRHAGQHSAGTVTLVDLFPTLLDHCELVSPKQTIEGLSLRPLLANPASAWERPALTIYEDRYFSARDPRYRYIQYPDGTEELYDHERDPHEFTNSANRQESAPIKQRFEKWKPALWATSLGGRKG